MEKQGNPPPYTGPYNGPQGGPQPGFQMPPPGMPQHDPQQTVIVTHTVAQVPVGPSPTSTTCPSCHAQIVTSVETETTTKTHLFALLLCLFGCCLCSCIPYCVDSCQAKTHYCPNCRAYIGRFEN
ncbi:uncharacterized protein [Diabrotica undecimpunctata]|uniref:uncharacterized protein isoform X1 n=1 Tax=Diabrotica undecimpunctata TaxID=50387 RepID=UPI003B6351E3